MMGCTLLNNKDYGRDVNFYSGNSAVQIKAVITEKNVKSVNVTVTKKGISGKFFEDGSRLTIQLDVCEMVELSKLIMQWHKNQNHFEAGYHGKSKCKVLYVNLNKKDGDLDKINFTIIDKTTEIGQISVNIDKKAVFEIAQILLERISLNANATITDTLNLFQITDKRQNL